MFTNYDLYDLYAVLSRVRFNPEYIFNEIILDYIVKLLENYEDSGSNCIRKALRNISGLDKELYSFVFVDNYYTYVPFIMKDKNIYEILMKACKSLLLTVQCKKNDQVIALADCLHNLPVEIAQCGFIPKHFWKYELQEYRREWDKAFLKN